MPIFGKPGAPNVFFVRQCYNTFYSEYLKKQQRVLLTGTPGIGKSVFGLYALWRLGQEQFPGVIVYINYAYSIYCSIHHNVVTPLTEQEAHASIMSEPVVRDGFVIVDAMAGNGKGTSKPLPAIPGKGLGISSPRPEGHGQFAKDDHRLA